MKKFLSILLCVMMVLSNVSYAIPSAIGAIDTAIESLMAEPVADVSEETADLSSYTDTVTTHEIYGDLMWQIHFDNTEVGWANCNNTWYWGGYQLYQNGATWNNTHGVVLGDSSSYNTGGNLQWGFYNGSVVEADSTSSGRYLTSSMPMYTSSDMTGYNDVMIRLAMDSNSKTATDKLYKEGVYTVAYDARISSDSTLVTSSNNMIRVYESSSSYSDYKNNESFVADGQWHTYTAGFSIPSDKSYVNDISVFAHSLKTATGTLDFDNLSVYYKPLTVNVTYTLDGETLATNAVSTTGVTVSDMVSGLDVGAPYVVSAIKINGTTYNADDTVTLCTSDVEAELILADNPYYDVHKGNVVFHITFDSLTAGSTPASYPFVSAVGYNTDAYKILDGVTPRLFLNNYGTLSAVANGDGVALQSTATGTGTTYWYVQHHTDSTGATAAPLLDTAVYTIEYDAKYSAIPTSQGISYYVSNGTGSGQTWKFTKTLDVSDTDWHTYSHTYDATGDTYGPSYLDVRYVAAAAGDVAQVDNFKIYAKPATATVTAMVGDEAFGTATVSTQGVTADAFIANFDLGDASKVITGVIFDGVTYTGTDSMIFGGENTVELVVEDNPYYDDVNGTIIFKQHFDGTTTGYTTTSTWMNNTEMTNGRYTAGIIEVTGFNMGVPSGAVVKEDTEGNGKGKYLSATLPLTSNDETIRLAITGGSDVVGVTAKGVYTFSYDLRLSSDAVLGSSTTNFIRLYYKPDGGTKAFETTNTNFVADGEWHTYTGVINIDASKYSLQDIYAYMHAVKTGTAGTADFDNFTVYYKAASTDVGVYKDDKLLTTVSDVATYGVLVSDLVSDVDINDISKTIGGIVYEGTTYALTDTVVLGLNAEVDLVIVDNPYYDVHKGELALHITFDSLTAGSTPASYPFVSAVGYNKDAYKILDGVTPRLFLNNFGTLSAVANGDGVALQSTATGTGTTYWYVQHHTDATGGTNEPMLAPAVYTIEYDAKYSAIPTSQGVTYYMSNGSGATHTWKFSKTFDVSDTDWHTYSHTYDATGDTYGPSYMDVRYVAAAAGDVAQVDNFKVYAKPATATVTAIDEDGVVGTLTLSTQGVTAEEIAENFMPDDVSKAVTGIIFDGVTYTGSDVLYFGGVNTVELVYGDNPDYYAGKGIYVLDWTFDNGTTANKTNSAGAWIGSVATVADFGGTYNPDYATTNGNIRFGPAGSVQDEDGRGGVFVSSLPTGDNELVRFVLTTNTDSPVYPAGVYVYEFDAKLNETTGTYAYGTPRLDAFGIALSDDLTSLAIVNDNEWHTYSKSYVLESDFTGRHDDYIHQTGLNVSGIEGTVYYDNIRIFYKPATIDMNIYNEEGVLVKTTKNLSTVDPVAVSDILDGYENTDSSVILSAVEIDGVAYGLEDTVTLGGSQTATLCFVPSLDKSIFGEALFTLDFDEATVTSHTGGWLAGNGGNTAYGVTCDSDWFVSGGNTFLSISGNIVDASGKGKILTGSLPLASGDTLLSFAHQAGSTTHVTEAGFYTLVYDVKLNAEGYTPGTYGTNVGLEGSTVRHNTDDFLLENDNKWHTYYFTFEVPTDTVGDYRLIQYQTGLASSSGATGTISIDDIELYYKPLTVNATVMCGTENLGTVAVSTNGATVGDMVNGITVDKFSVIDTVKYDGVVYDVDDATSFILSDDITVEVTLGENKLYSKTNGDLVLNVDFESIDTATLTRWSKIGIVGGQVYKVAENITAANTAFDWSGVYSSNPSNDAATAVGPDGSKAARIPHASTGLLGWSIYDASASLGTGNFDPMVEPGVYTLEFDVKLGSATSDARIRFGASTVNNSSPENTSGAYTDLYFMDQIVDTTGWNHVVLSIDMSDKEYGLGLIRAYVSLTEGSEALYDNIVLYTKPATVNVTVKNGEETAATKTVSTTGVLVSDLVSGIDVGTKYVISGVVYDGNTYASTDTITFAYDSEVSIVVSDNPYFNSNFGTAIFKQHFDGTTTGYTTTSTWQNNDEMKNGRYTAGIIEVTGFNMGVPSGAVVTEDTEGNGKGKYLSATLPLTSNDETIRLAITGGSDVVGVTAKGVYTFTYDLRLSTDTVLGSSTTNFIRLYYKPDGGTKAYEATNTEFVADGEWHTYTATILIDDDKYSLQDIYAYMHAVKNATAGTADFDNFTVYYNANTSTVIDVLPGANTAVEAQKVSVPTNGFTVANLKETVDVSSTSKPITGFIYNGVTYGESDVAYVADGGEVTLLWGKPDMTNVYGDTMFKVHFNEVVTGTSFSNWNWATALRGDSSTAPSVGAYADTTHGTVIGSGFNFQFGFSGTIADADSASDGKYISTTMPMTVADSMFRLALDGGSKSAAQLSKEGVYTVAIDVRIAEGATLASTTNNFVRAHTNDGTYNNYAFDNAWVADGEWHTYTATINIPNDRANICDIEIFAHDLKGGSGTVDIDNLTISYKPATVTATVVVGENEYSTEISTAGAVISDIISASGAVSSNPYKSISGVSYDGTAYALTDSIVTAKNIKVTATLAGDDTVEPDRGQLALDVTFDLLTSDLARWPALSQVGGTNYLINATGVGVNFSFSNYLSANLTTDNYSVHTDDSDLALRFVKPADGWHNFSIYDGNTGGGGNYDQLLVPGVYYIEFDAKFSVVPTNMMIRPGRYLANADPGAEGNWVQTNFTVPDTEWNHYGVFVDYSEYAEGLANVQFFVNAATGTVCEYDNIKIWYKPATTTVTYMNGSDVVGTKTVSTTGVTAADLTADVKVRGYEITAVTYADVTYAVDSEELIKFAFDTETVYLTVTKLPISEFAPETKATAAIRTDDPIGLRFAATMVTADETVEEAGWVVTRKALLDAAGIEVSDFNRTSDVKKVEGLNIDGVNADKIFATENNIDTFTAVLIGITSANYDDEIVAVPFVVDYDTWYGEAYVGTYRAAAQAILDSGANLTTYQRTLLDEIVNA